MGKGGGGGGGGGGFMQGPAAGGLMGMMKYNLVDRPREDRQRNLAATTSYYSPWTGMKIGEVGGMPQEGSMIEAGLKGAGAAGSQQGR